MKLKISLRGHSMCLAFALTPAILLLVTISWPTDSYAHLGPALPPTPSLFEIIREFFGF